MRFAICNEIFKDWPFDRICEFAKQAGYDALELAPFAFAPLVTEISPAWRNELRGTAVRAGIAISGIHWVLAYTDGMHVNSPDMASRRRASAYLVEAVNFCADVGGQSMIFGSPKRRDILPGVTPELAADWTLETFRAAAARGEERGVTICLEPLSPTETNFLNTAADTIALAKRMNSPAFKIMLDVKAMCSEAKSIPQIIRESAGKFAYFHANDRNLKGPGFGDVDFAPIAGALKEVGYDGTVSVEVFKFEEGPEAIATRSRECLRKAFGV